MTMFDAYQGYFDKNTGTPGASQAWAGGNLTMGQGGNATFTDPTGVQSNFNRNTPLADVYNNNPFIANTWDEKYGADITGTFAPQSNFEIPTNLFPTSTSNQSSSQSGNSSNKGSSQSQSGMNWTSDFMKNLMPSLNQSLTGLQGRVDEMGGTLQDQYSNLMRRSMQPENFQGVLNSLANKGMINSTTGENTMATAGKGIAQSVADKAFESQLQQQLASLQVPGILSNAAGLGQESSAKSSSSGQSSTSGGSTSTSTYSNPLAPFELMASMVKY